MQAATTAANNERDCYDNFMIALRTKAPATAIYYQSSLKSFSQSIKTEVADLVRMDALQIEDKMKDYFETASAAKAAKVSAALRLFFAVNRININWDHVRLFKPASPEGEPQDRPYDKTEIESLLQRASKRTRLAILIMATGGLRVGALNSIRVKDLTWIEGERLYCLSVYPNTKAQYLTFLTPQTSTFLAKFIEGRGMDEPVFYNLFRPAKQVTRIALIVAMWRLLVKTGFRTPAADRLERQEVQLNHGLRKFYRTTLENSGIKEEHAEKLLDHGPKLVRTYARPKPAEWLATSGYLQAVPALTFDFS